MTPDQLIEPVNFNPGFQLSPAIQELLRRYDDIRNNVNQALIVNKRCHQEEAKLDSNYKQRKEELFITYRGEGLSVRDSEAKVAVELADTYVKLTQVAATRRATQDALNAWCRELDLIQAALHAHNREVRYMQGQRG